MVYKPVTIAGVRFATRGDAEKRCRQILNGGSINSRVEGPDHMFVYDLWLSRPDKLAKAGGRKVVEFKRNYRDSKENWTRCFWAVLEDGTEIDFSFKKAVTNLIAAQAA